jgi:Uma2 family endonuclease
MTTDVTPQVPPEPQRTSVERFLALVEEGMLTGSDRVELLEGVIVSMAPSNPPHAAALGLACEALRAALGPAACLRVQSPLVLGPWSAPEPDIALVEGSHRDWSLRHPTSARLVVEISDWSRHQDRLTKAPIYARAGIPEYWIVDLVERCVEILRDPDRTRARYGLQRFARGQDLIETLAAPGVPIAVRNLLPATS